MTNAEIIRSLTDEELAVFLVTFKNTFGVEYEGEKSCLDWLKEERLSERIEPKPVTMNDIEEKFGYPVEIVSEKEKREYENTMCKRLQE